MWSLLSRWAGPCPQGESWSGFCLLQAPGLCARAPRPGSPGSSPRCRGRMRAAGVSRLWRINIPGTSPRPPAHAEENITAISGGSSACTQYLDGEFGVINLALSSSLRGPPGSGMFGMGKKPGSAAILPGALWGSARATAVPGAGYRPLGGPPGGPIALVCGRWRTASIEKCVQNLSPPDTAAPTPRPFSPLSRLLRSMSQTHVQVVASLPFLPPFWASVSSSVQ